MKWSQVLVIGLFLPWLVGCGEKPDVVLYCALDQVHAESLVRKFESLTGLRVDAQWDTEATKSVGLTGRIIAEATHPRCDVFWNNEIMNTLRLKQKNLLQPYLSPEAAALPSEFKDPEGYWTGFAARARVFIVNTEKMGEERPASLWDLTDPRFRGRCGMARPLAGTTLTHFTVLYDALGEARMREFLDGIVANEIVITTGNAQVMRQVREGRFDYGLTDTDDFNVALTEGFPVEAVYPDQEEGGLGTMLIPNTVALIKGCPHPDAGRKLVDFILSAEVERVLAFSRSAQIPLRPGVEKPANVKGSRDFKVMSVDFASAAAHYDERAKELEERFRR
ncbi:MAG: extracellular solute-binding protein [Planctomycetota bacterium]